MSNIKLHIGLLVLFAVFLATQPTLAQEQCIDGGGEENIEEYVEGPDTAYALEQPIGTKTSVETIGEYTNLIYQFALGIVGIMAVVLIMFGGIRWISAAGNEQTIGDAKEIIVSAVIGLVIALLSYSILVFINPRFTNLDLAVIKIPVQTQCGFTIPAMVTIEDRDGLDGDGRQICQGAAKELYAIVERMRTDSTSTSTYCSTCTIVVNSGYRSSESQAQLRECYEKAVSELGVEDGSKCTDGCTTCNPANEPCCSKHEIGTALDLALTGFPESKGLASSDGYLKASYNGGGGVAGLAANQEFLKAVMMSGEYDPISNEWWHFEFEGDCGVDYQHICEKNAATGYADNGYCQIQSGVYTGYTLANCDSGVLSCPVMEAGQTEYIITPGVCGKNSPTNPNTHYTPADDPFTTAPICARD